METQSDNEVGRVLAHPAYVEAMPLINGRAIEPQERNKLIIEMRQTVTRDCGIEPTAAPEVFNLAAMITLLGNLSRGEA